jgi:hypothetical protein
MAALHRFPGTVVKGCLLVDFSNLGDHRLRSWGYLREHLGPGQQRHGSLGKHLPDCLPHPEHRVRGSPPP